MLTDPVVNTPILDGSARITGNYTLQSAKELATNINTGIVPAPIYLSSERTIDAKVGGEALHQILMAGLIGLVAIIVFLISLYRLSGLLAAIALVTYTLILIALVKMTGVVLTLASIAGVILSIGLAIDANILIFERMREALRDGKTLDQAVVL
jgi:preprotein translocase subunit SecD